VSDLEDGKKKIFLCFFKVFVPIPDTAFGSIRLETNVSVYNTILSLTFSSVHCEKISFKVLFQYII
jgi:hypothetical protein